MRKQGKGAGRILSALFKVYGFSEWFLVDFKHRHLGKWIDFVYYLCLNILMGGIIPTFSR
jgi:hypothetical protein